MNNKTPKKGDLVFIPSGTTLIKLLDGVVKEWVSLEKPASVVVAGISRDSDVEYYSVIYAGSGWLARPIDCYEVEHETN